MPDKTPELNLPVEIEAASKFYDLRIDNPLDTKQIGLAADVLNILGIEFRNQVIKENFNQEFAKIHQNIYDSIQSPGTGYLLEIVVYTDTDGFVTLPQGRLLNPIGVGAEALDAMANYLNTDRMVPGGIAPRSLINGSSFLWITKTGGKISARSIPNAFYEKFLTLANDEAKKRNLMGQWIRPTDESNLKFIQIAEFWNELERQKKMLLEDEAARRKVEKLTNEMRLLQENANEIFKQFQKTQQEMVRRQKLTSMLNAISAVAGLIKSGIEINEMMSIADQPVKNGSDSHLLSLEETEILNQSRLTQLGNLNTQLTTRTKEYLDEMGAIHKELSIIYDVQVEPVPKIDNDPLLLLP